MIDQAADTSLSLQTKLINAYDAPPYVKSASYVDKVGHHELPSVAFVGPLRTLPVHTKAATWLSAAFLAHHAPTDTDISNDETFLKVAEAANRWGIFADVYSLWEKQVAAKEKPEAAYALEYEENGTIKRAFPIRNATELQKAAALCEEHFKQMPVPQVQKMASTILQQASAMNVSLTNQDLLMRLCGAGIFDANVFAEQLQKRAYYLQRKEPVLAGDLQTLAKRAGSFSTDVESREQATALLALTDQTYGFDERTHPDLIPAALLQANYTFKEASQGLSELVPLQNGVVFTQDTLHCLTPAEYRDIFGEDFVKEASDLLQPDRLDTFALTSLVKTLPRPDAAHLTDAIVAKGGQPVSVEPSALSAFR